VKIMMVTAAEALQDVILSFKAQCDEYLVKPIDAAKLLEKLRKMGLIA